MTAVLKNDFYRLLVKKTRLVMIFVLTAAAVAAAIALNGQALVLGNVALVTDNASAVPSTPYLRISVLREKPPASELVSNLYDAVAVDSGNGTYAVETFKSDALKQNLEKLLAHPGAFTPDTTGVRGAGTNILGFLMTFVLLNAVMLMYQFAEDKEKKQLGRIAASPLSVPRYLVGQSLFTFAVIFLPTMLVLYAVKAVMGADIGFGFLQYASLLALLTLFGVSLSLFLTAVFKKGDSANMMGSTLVMMTTILSGSFYAFEKGNNLLQAIISVLPQKQFLNLAEQLERGRPLDLTALLYLLALTAVFFAAAAVKTRRDYVGSN